MPTSLPASRLVETTDHSDISYNPGAFWLLIVWAIAMLLFGALDSFGGMIESTVAFDPVILF